MPRDPTPLVKLMVRTQLIKDLRLQMPLYQFYDVFPIAACFDPLFFVFNNRRTLISRRQVYEVNEAHQVVHQVNQVNEGSQVHGVHAHEKSMKYQTICKTGRHPWLKNRFLGYKRC